MGPGPGVAGRSLRFVRVPGTSVHRATGTGFGAEFATHLKVARNWALPNPRSPARGAGAERPQRGRGEVREARGLPLKVAMLSRLATGAHRLEEPSEWEIWRWETEAKRWVWAGRNEGNSES